MGHRFTKIYLPGINKVVSPKSHLPWNRVDSPNVTIYRRLIITMKTFKGSGEPGQLPNAVVFIASFLSSGKIANDFHGRLILTYARA